MVSNESDNNDSSSQNDSSSDSDDSFGELLIITKMQEYYSRSLTKMPCRTSQLTGREYMLELLNGHPNRLFDMMRMDKNTFMKLCSTLRTLNFLEDDRAIRVEEMVGMFLYTVGHSSRNIVVAEKFQHLNETVSRQFKKVLKAICKLGCRIIRPRNMDETPPEIMGNPKYYPWFKDCIGAIDGTHISAWAPASKQTPYRGRKVQVTQNIMCACSFDMLFTFVYTGWEGTANDSRVLFDVMSKEENEFPMPTEGMEFKVVKVMFFFILTWKNN